MYCLHQSQFTFGRLVFVHRWACRHFNQPGEDTRAYYIHIFSRFSLSWTNLVGLHVFFQVCPAESSVPVISDVSSIHDLPEQIPKVLPWHLHHHNHYKITANTIIIIFISLIMVLCTIASTHNTNNNTSHLCISLQVVVEYVNWYCQVSGVEGVLSVPTLGSKLPPLRHTGVEVTQREEDSLKLLFTTALVQDVLERGQWIKN